MYKKKYYNEATKTEKMWHNSSMIKYTEMVEDPEENRQIFSVLKKLSVDIRDKNVNNINMDILSMGMTGDYRVAIEEGATMVRVGTAIFGARDYGGIS